MAALTLEVTTVASLSASAPLSLRKFVDALTEMYDIGGERIGEEQNGCAGSRTSIKKAGMMSNDIDINFWQIDASQTA
jgi:hypothetical protein